MASPSAKVEPQENAAPVENKRRNKSSLSSFGQQTYALTKKNIILQQRNVKASCTTYFVCLLFLAILALAGIPISSMFKRGLPESRDDPSPPTYPMETFKCTRGPGKDKCYQFSCQIFW